MTNNQSRPDRPNTYFVQDRSNEEELTRLQVQDQMFTTSMGGALPEQEAPERLRRILDVACGTGYWLLEAVRAYPNLSLAVGVDISERMIGYARAQAQAQQMGDQVEFHVMDALLILEFPENTFDLINLRFGLSFVRTWEWPKLLDEFRRVCRQDGMIRITESDFAYSNSPALTRLLALAQQAFYQAGHLFHNERDGVISELAALLPRHGLTQVQTHRHVLTFRAGTPEGDRFAQDMQHAFRTILPFLRRKIRVPEDYEETYQQALIEMQQPDFVGRWNVLTVWGQNTPRQKPEGVRLD